MACPDEPITGALASQLEKSTSVRGIYFLQDISLQSTSFLMHVAEKSSADYVLLQLKPVAITLGAGALERMMAVASDTGAAMVYADRYEVKNGVVERHPVIDYQEGSLRDDFDFGTQVAFFFSIKVFVQMKQTSLTTQKQTEIVEARIAVVGLTIAICIFV